MLSRIAESLYWIGRYVERAEDTSRIVDVHLSLLLDDPWAPEDVVCASLLLRYQLTSSYRSPALVFRRPSPTTHPQSPANNTLSYQVHLPSDPRTKHVCPCPLALSAVARADLPLARVTGNYSLPCIRLSCCRRPERHVATAR